MRHNKKDPKVVQSWVAAGWDCLQVSTRHRRSGARLMHGVLLYCALDIKNSWSTGQHLGWVVWWGVAWLLLEEHKTTQTQEPHKPWFLESLVLGFGTYAFGASIVGSGMAVAAGLCAFLQHPRLRGEPRRMNGGRQCFPIAQSQLSLSLVFFIWCGIWS